MYKELYKFNQAPFSLEPDSECFFQNDGHKKVLSYLKYGLSRREGYVLITGEEGAGKTTLVNRFIEQLDEQVYQVAYLKSTEANEVEVLALICKLFGLPYENLTKGILLNQFKAYLHATHQSKRKVILIFDDAHYLVPKTLEEIRMLSNFQSDNHSLVQSFFIAQEPFIETINQANFEQLKQRIISSWKMKDLNLEESKDYIHYRLKNAGWSIASPFENNTFDLIHSFTQGNPKQINIFCHRLFIFAAKNNLQCFKIEHIRLVIAELKFEHCE